MLQSLLATTAEPGRNAELIVRLDDDDPDLAARQALLRRFGLDFPTKVITGPRAWMGVMTLQMASAAHGSHLWLLNDDIIHQTPCWDRLVREATTERPTHTFFPDDGLFGSQLACFPLIPKVHWDATYGFGVARYERYLIDSIISDVYDALDGLGRLVYLPQWKLQHLNAHPSSEIDPRWFHRTAQNGRVYQPARPDLLLRDEQRYLAHLTERPRLMEQIRATDGAHV